MEEASWRRHQGEGIREEASLGRHRGGGIMQEASWRRHQGAFGGGDGAVAAGGPRWLRPTNFWRSLEH